MTSGICGGRISKANVGKMGEEEVKTEAWRNTPYPASWCDAIKWVGSGSQGEGEIR